MKPMILLLLFEARSASNTLTNSYRKVHEKLEPRVPQSLAEGEEKNQRTGFGEFQIIHKAV
jgi:hypothetical protein